MKTTTSSNTDVTIEMTKTNIQICVLYVDLCTVCVLYVDFKKPLEY